MAQRRLFKAAFLSAQLDEPVASLQPDQIICKWTRDAVVVRLTKSTEPQAPLPHFVVVLRLFTLNELFSARFWVCCDLIEQCLSVFQAIYGSGREETVNVVMQATTFNY